MAAAASLRRGAYSRLLGLELPANPVVRSTLHGAARRERGPCRMRKDGTPGHRDKHRRSRTSHSQQPVTARDYRFSGFQLAPGSSSILR